MINKIYKKIPWNKGKKGLYKHTQEWRINMSRKMKDRKITWGNKISNSLLGKKLTEEHKQKLSEAKKGKKQSQSQIDKRVKKLKGRKRKPFSEEHKRKLSESHKGNIGFWIGKKRPSHSKKTRKKMSEAHKGEKSYRWKGGITPINQKIRTSLEYRLWRESVFLRDNWTCQKCKIKGGKLNSHHIKHFSENLELRFDVNNGITLCEKCHNLEHNHIFNRHISKFGVFVEFPSIETLENK